MITAVRTEVLPLSLSLSACLHPLLCQLTQTALILGQPRDSLLRQLPGSLCPQSAGPSEMPAASESCISTRDAVKDRPGKGKETEEEHKKWEEDEKRKSKEKRI